MIDVKYLREAPEEYRHAAKEKGMGAEAIEVALKLDASRRQLIGEAEPIRAQLNIKGKPTPEELTKLQTAKAKLAEIDVKLQTVEAEFAQALLSIPNLLAPNTPSGGEEHNREDRAWGGQPKHDFEAKEHLAIAEAHGWIDFERGAKVAGSKFYYLKGAIVRLELAVTQMIFDRLHQDGLEPVLVPHMVNSRVLEASGYQPRGEEQQSYKIEGDDLTLIGTAEIPLTGFYGDEILSEAQLPSAFAGLSPAYRREAGAYGKYSKGLYRVHQFNKLEMYVFCKPEESASWHQKLVKIEEDICQALELPYRVVRIAAGDMGAPAYEKYDIEYWSPLEQTYHELMSCSNVTDFQARRLNIRYRADDGSVQFVHTLNGTAAAFSRMPIAIIENHQQADGSVRVPQALLPYFGRESL
ncbi:serine--tRNA ligase [Candidatus Saccharibacteria bacterium]|nr:serine--tRNA ligase [Candidatus Saccharibacteria bacterium]